MNLTVNEDLLRKAHGVLANRQHIYWILGGAGAGKSTICQAIGQMYNIPIYDMDAFIYDKYQPRYSDERHPANRAWFGAENPLAWALALPTAEFGDLLTVADAEYLDLFTEDIGGLPADHALLVDGGLAHPAILARVLPVERIACLEIDEALSDAVWESAERSEMKAMIHPLADVPEPWRKFQAANALIVRTMTSESSACGIRLFPRRAGVTVEALAAQIAGAFGLTVS